LHCLGDGRQQVLKHSAPALVDFCGDLHACASWQLLAGRADEVLLVQRDAGFVGSYLAGGVGGAAGAAAACVAAAVDLGGIGAHMHHLAGKQAVFLEGVGSQLDLGTLAYLDKADVFVFNGDVSKQGLAQG
jgi:hypothetical protein